MVQALRASHKQVKEPNLPEQLNFPRHAIAKLEKFHSVRGPNQLQMFKSEDTTGVLSKQLTVSMDK